MRYTTPLVLHYELNGRPNKELNKLVNDAAFTFMNRKPSCIEDGCDDGDGIELRYSSLREMPIYQCERHNIEQTLSEHAEYEVGENGRIKTAGKFEGSYAWTPYIWTEAILSSGYEEAVISATGTEVDYVKITKEDARLYPNQLTEGNYVRLWETEQGFVFSQHSSKAEMNHHIEAANESLQTDEAYRTERGY